MAKLMYLQASPRKDRSKSRQVADAFVEAYRQAHGDDEIVTIDLFQADLPSFDGPALDAKYAILHGQSPSDEQKTAWKAVEDVIGEFLSADKYVFAVPMWNFGVPYRLKHYLDILVQPTYTFSFSPESGYSGLVTGKPAMVLYARGGDYADPEIAAAVDHQKTYLELILGFIGITEVKSIIIQPTVMDGPEVGRQKADEAAARVREWAERF